MGQRIYHHLVIYLDHNATTPIRAEVLDAMMPYLTTDWGNPSSTYKFGSKLKSAIELARGHVAELLCANPSEIIFTSCATESNNTAICSALAANPNKRHIVTSSVEHSSVLNHCLALQRQGYDVTYLPVDRDGLLNIRNLEKAISENTAIVSLMWANNETGVLFPIEEIAHLCRSRGVLCHCDAVQAAGKVPIDLRHFPIDYLSITGHKIYAPKGIGALFVRRNAPFESHIVGGHQERSRRGGTENVPLIVALGKAAELVQKELRKYVRDVAGLRDKFENEVLLRIHDCEVNGHRTLRLCNTSNISFHGIHSEALLILLDQEGICASSGSACLSDSDEPSHVVRAMKPESAASREMLRFSLGAELEPSMIEAVVAALHRTIEVLRM